MSKPRLPIERLKHLMQFETSDLTTHEIGLVVGLSQGSVSKYQCALRAAGISWQEAQHWNDEELQRRVSAARAMQPVRHIAVPDCAWIHSELKRHKHVTLQLLWEEYQVSHGKLALRYSAFCDRYRDWLKRLKRSMRQRHFAGEKVFVDYAGRTVPIYDARCEQSYRASLFVSALGASGYAYAEATRTASLPDWLASHVRMLDFYGASPAILVPDNPRVGVTKADRYEPELQRSYEEMASHFGMVVIPARPYLPFTRIGMSRTSLHICFTEASGECTQETNHLS